MKLDDESQIRAAEDDARRLLETNSEILSRVLTHLTREAVEDMLATGPAEREKREHIYMKISAIKDVDSIIRNMAARSKNRKTEAANKINPA